MATGNWAAMEIGPQLWSFQPGSICDSGLPPHTPAVVVAPKNPTAPDVGEVPAILAPLPSPAAGVVPMTQQTPGAAEMPATLVPVVVMPVTAPTPAAQNPGQNCEASETQGLCHDASCSVLLSSIKPTSGVEREMEGGRERGEES